MTTIINGNEQHQHDNSNGYDNCYEHIFLLTLSLIHIRSGSYK